MPAVDLAPAVLPVRLAQRAYLVDLTEYERSVIPALRTDSDTTARSGEASVSTQGLWFRWADSFHYGAGQRFYDLDPELAGRAANRYQYWRSAHVDPWTAHELHLLPRLADRRDVTGTTIRLLQTPTTVFALDGQRLAWTTDTEVWHELYYPPWGQAEVYDLNTGTNALYVATANGLWRSELVTGMSSAWEQLLAGAFHMVLPYGGEVLVGQGPVLKVLRRNTADTGWELEPVFTHIDPNFRWTLRSPGPDGWYVGGQATIRSELLRFAVDPTEPTRIIHTGNVVSLPNGERILAARFYVGAWFFGTTRGVRMGLSDANGITLQALVPIGPTPDLSPDGDSVYAVTYGTTDVPTGAVRIEPSRFTEAGVPAWAPDLGWDEFPVYPLSAIRPWRMAVARLEGKTLVGMAQGILVDRTYADVRQEWATYADVKAQVIQYADLYSRRHTELTRIWGPGDQCEPVGWLETGVINFGMPFPKALHDVTLHTRPLPLGASVEVLWRPTGTTAWRSLGVKTTPGSTEHHFTTDWPTFQALELRFVLATGSTFWTYGHVKARWSDYAAVRTANPTYQYLKYDGKIPGETPDACPVLTDWTLRATPQIEQSLDQIVLPLVFHSELAGGIDGRQALAQNVHEEFCYLTDLVRRQQIVEFVEGGEMCHVKLTGALLKPDHFIYERAAFGFYEANLQVSLQVLDACQTPQVNPLVKGNGHVPDVHPT